MQDIGEGWGSYKFDNEWLDFVEIEPFVVDFAFKKSSLVSRRMFLALLKRALYALARFYYALVVGSAVRWPGGTVTRWFVAFALRSLIM